MRRRRGLSVRWKLTLSYAGFLVVAGALLLAAVWAYLLRYVPDRALLVSADPKTGVFPIRTNLLHTFAPRAAAVMVLLLVVGLVGGWLLAGRMLAPLDRIAAAARLADGGSLSHRIRLEGRDDEFRELADSFDAMLDRLEAHVAEQQRFAANASHELRTPLAITSALLDVARTDPARDADVLVERLQGVNARAIELTEALLMLSRADQRSFDPEPVDLSLVAEEAVEALLPLAEKHGVSLEVAGDVTPVSGSAALLQQLATNLLHNAIVHNRPSGGTAWIRTEVRGSSAVLVVENTGDELDPTRVATLVEPFQRGSGRARSDQAGVGLGLAIADTIARAHHGTLAVRARPGGGLTASVALPQVSTRTRARASTNPISTGTASRV